MNFANSTRLISRTAAATLAILLALPGAALHAQEAIMLEELTVTARKQEQSIQDVPISITAFDSQQIEAAAFNDIVDVSKASPGVFIESMNNEPARISVSPRFRGVVVDSTSPLRRTAGIFVDGMVVTGGLYSIDVQELERVEVIKGPQSALFGRNTFSGAINYITRAPADEPAVHLSMDVGPRGERDFRASVEGPLLHNLGGRLYANSREKDGHWHNVDPQAAAEKQRLGREESMALGGVLQFEPIEQLNIRVRGNFYRDEDGPAAVIRRAGLADHNFCAAGNPNNLRGVALLAACSGGETEFRGAIPPPPPSEIGLNTSKAHYDEVTARILSDRRPVNFHDIDFDDLGGFGLLREGYRFSVVTSYDIVDSLRLDVLANINEDQYLYMIDFDATPDLAPPGTFTFGRFGRPVSGDPAGFISRGVRKTEDKGLEVRVSGSALYDDQLNWSLGVSLVDVETSSAGGFYDPLGIFGFALSSLYDPLDPATAETTGVFGSIDYRLNEQWKLILEARQQEDEISDTVVHETSAIGRFSPNETYKEFLPRILLQYRPFDDTMLYASYSVGNFPGGFNTQVARLDNTENLPTNIPDPAGGEDATLILTRLEQFNRQAPGVTAEYDEETLTNYELGLKQTAWNGRLAYSLAAFYMEREDQIYSAFETVTARRSRTNPVPSAAVTNTVEFNANGATSNILGLELDGSWQATDSLLLAGTLAYVRSEIDSFPEGAGAGDFSDIFGLDQNPKGQRPPRFPEWTASLSSTYTRPVTVADQSADWYLRSDIYYTGSYFGSNANLSKLPRSTEINLRSGIRRDSLSMEFYVTNLTNENAPTAGNNIADTGAYVRTRNLPATAYDFFRESVHVALRDQRQIGLRLSKTFN